MSFKLVNAADYYQQRRCQYNVWVDKSGDEAYMANLVNEGEDLHIVGVVQPKARCEHRVAHDGHLLHAGSSWTHLVEEASQAQVVQRPAGGPEP